jgi:hypothetical protein
MDGCMEWIDLSQDRAKWWAVVNMILINLWSPKNVGSFLTK